MEFLTLCRGVSCFQLYTSGLGKRQNDHLDFLIHHILLKQICLPCFSVHQKLSVFKFAQSANLPNTERIHDEGYETNILDEKLEHVRLKLLVKSEGVANSSHLGKTYHRLICTSLINHHYSLSHWCLAVNLGLAFSMGKLFLTDY